MVEPWLAGCPEAIEKQLKEIVSFPPEKVAKLLSTEVAAPIEEKEVEISVHDRKKFTGKVREGNMICMDEDRQVVEVEIVLDRPISIADLDVGHSVAVFPQNTEADADRVIKAFEWDASELLGNLTVKELLI